MALRIERRAAQRTWGTTGTYDPGGARHERSGGVGGHPNAKEIRAVLVFVIVFVGVDLLAVL